MAARDFDSAIHVQHGFGVIEHRGRTFADPHGMDAAFIETFDESGLQYRRADATVITYGDFLAACTPDQRAETATDGIGIGFAQRFADNATNVIFAQRCRVKTVRHASSCLSEIVRGVTDRGPNLVHCACAISHNAAIAHRALR